MADGSLAYSVDGSPTDAVSLAFLGYFGHGFDLVAAGINYGANLGDDITYSGTVSAAMEAVINNCPAFAISQEYYEHPDFTLAGRAATAVARNILEHGLSPGELLNVNVPAVEPDEFAGFEVTRLGKRVYQDQLIERQDPRGIPYFWIGGPPPSGLAVPGTDFHAVVNRQIAVTPIHLDLTGRRLLKRLRTWDWSMPDEPTSRSPEDREPPPRLNGRSITSMEARPHGGPTMDDLEHALALGAGIRPAPIWPRPVAPGDSRGVGGLDGLLEQAARRRPRRRGRLVGIDRPDHAGARSGALGSTRSGRTRSSSLSAGSGLDVGQLLPMLAAFLPQIINMLTPMAVPSGGLNGATGGGRTSAGARRTAAEGADPCRPIRPPSDVHAGSATDGRLPRRVQPRGQSSGHEHRRSPSPHPPVPREGAGRVAVHGPAGRRPAPRPDLVLVGRRGASRLLQAGRPEGPQPARKPVGDARPGRCRGRLRHRAHRGSSGAPRPPDREVLPAAHLDKYAEKLARSA